MKYNIFEKIIYKLIVLTKNRRKFAAGFSK
jgi:hypothetical protein